MTGASGNVGTSLVEELVGVPGVEEVVGVCRRAHEWRPARTRWVWGDLAEVDLGEVVAGADVVVHLAWLFQPTRRPQVTWRANVLGTRRLLDAVETAGVPALVMASSVGAYSPREDLEPVAESWPTHGVPEAAYSREKAYVERMLDDLEARNPTSGSCGCDRRSRSAAGPRCSSGASSWARWCRTRSSGEAGSPSCHCRQSSGCSWCTARTWPGPTSPP